MTERFDRPPLPPRPPMARPPMARPTLVRPGPPVVAKARPDPRPMRLMFGLAGLAAVSAMATSVVTPAPSSADVAQIAAPDPTAQTVQHVTRYVTLAPGATAPAQAAVRLLPAPSPRVVVVTVKTKQSAKP